MKTEITVSNLPNLGIEPYKRFDENRSLTDVLYHFDNGSTIFIQFNEDGFVSYMSYNGFILPNNSRIELTNGDLLIRIPSE